MTAPEKERMQIILERRCGVSHPFCSNRGMTDDTMIRRGDTIKRRGYAETYIALLFKYCSVLLPERFGITRNECGYLAPSAAMRRSPERTIRFQSCAAIPSENAIRGSAPESFAPSAAFAFPENFVCPLYE